MAVKANARAVKTRRSVSIWHGILTDFHTLKTYHGGTETRRSAETLRNRHEKRWAMAWSASVRGDLRLFVFLRFSVPPWWIFSNCTTTVGQAHWTREPLTL